MIAKLLKRIAYSRQPNYFDDQLMIWYVGPLRLVVQLRDQVPWGHAYRAFWWVFDGALMLHRTVPATTKSRDGLYVYDDIDGDHAARELIYAPRWLYMKRLQGFMVELHPARTSLEARFDPPWLPKPLTDTMRQAWRLEIRW